MSTPARVAPLPGERGWRPQLVALDIDGTLLRWVTGPGSTHEQVPPAVRAAVRRAARSGAHVVLDCTTVPVPDGLTRAEHLARRFPTIDRALRDRGIDGATAGLIVAVSILLQMTGSLFAPVLAARMADQRVLNAAVALMAGGGFVLSIFGPLQLIWVWTGLLGLGQGALTAVSAW